MLALRATIIVLVPNGTGFGSTEVSSGVDSLPDSRRTLKDGQLEDFAEAGLFSFDLERHPRGITLASEIRPPKRQAACRGEARASWFLEQRTANNEDHDEHQEEGNGAGSSLKSIERIAWRRA